MCSTGKQSLIMKLEKRSRVGDEQGRKFNVMQCNVM